MCCSILAGHRTCGGLSSPATQSIETAKADIRPETIHLRVAPCVAALLICQLPIAAGREYEEGHRKQLMLSLPWLCGIVCPHSSRTGHASAASSADADAMEMGSRASSPADSRKAVARSSGADALEADPAQAWLHHAMLSRV